MQARKAYFDVAKFIALAAVIISHTAIRFSGGQIAPDVTGHVISFCFSFHLPLFFVISGYFLGDRTVLRIKKDARSLIIPYLVTCVAVVVGLGFASALNNNGGVRLTLLSWINASIFGAGSMVSNPLWHQDCRIGAIWFLLALFFSRIFTTLVNRAKPVVRPAVILVLFLSGLISARYVFLPLSLQPALCASLFVYFGTVLRRREANFAALDKSRRAILMVISAIAWGYAVVNYKGFSIAACDFGSNLFQVITNVIGGFSSSVFILMALRGAEGALGEKRWYGCVSGMGRFTLVVLCVHLFEDNVLPWDAVISAIGSTGIAGSLLFACVALGRVALDFAAGFLLTYLFGCCNSRDGMPGWMDSRFPSYSFSVGNILAVAAILFLAWLPYLFAYFPGIVEIDTVFQIAEANGLGVGGGYGTGTWTSLFPYGTALIMGGIFRLGWLLSGSQAYGIALITTVQMVSIALALSVCLNYLSRLNLSSSVITLLLAFSALNPVIGTQVVTIGKDPLFSIPLMYFSVGICEAIRTQFSCVLRPSWILGLCLCGCAMTAFRSTGLMVFCVGIIFMTSSYVRTSFIEKRTFATCWPRLLTLALVLSVSFLTQHFVSCFGSTDLVVNSTSVRELYGTPMQQTTAVYLKNSSSITADELASLRSFYDVEAASESFEPQMNDQVKTKIYSNISDADVRSFRQAWVSIGAKNVPLYIGAWTDLISGYLTFGSYDSIALPRFIPSPAAMSELGTRFSDGVDIDGDPYGVLNTLLVTGSSYSAGLLPEYAQEYPWFGDWGMDPSTAWYRNALMKLVALIGKVPVACLLVSKASYSFWGPLLVLLIWAFHRKKLPLSVLVPYGSMAVLSLVSPVDLTRYIVPCLLLTPLVIGVCLSSSDRHGE